MPNDKQPDRADMSLMLNRLSLISRYNRCVGEPGPMVADVQRDFINGLMDSRIVPTFVAEYETIIESRRPMHKPPGA
jgi:hypothetical protein